MERIQTVLLRYALDTSSHLFQHTHLNHKCIQPVGKKNSFLLLCRTIIKVVMHDLRTFLCLRVCNFQHTDTFALKLQQEV
jgi:hypothetical protein